MKKVILSLLFAAGISFSASAQESKVKLSVGAEAALPIGDIADAYNLGYGGSIQGAFSIAKPIDVTLSAGYLNFSYKQEIKDLLKNFGEDTKGDGAIPVKAGAKYFFGKFYGAGELGASFSTAEEANTAFIYAPTIGVSFPVAKKSNLDVGLRYEGWASNGNTSSFIGLRAAWSLKL